MKRILLMLLLLATAGLASAADPTNVTGCVLWFKADAGVYTNAGGKVTNWVDQAHGIQATNSSAAPAVPTITASWANGRPALYWSATAVYGLTMPAGSLAITNGQNRTIFLVLARGSGEMFGPGSSTRLGLETDGRITLRNNNYFYTDAQLQSGLAYIITVVAQAGSPTNVSVFRNGELVGSTNNYDCAFYPLTNELGVGWTLFTSAPRSFTSGRLAEMVVFDRALGTNDHTAVGQYLSLKYAIPSFYVPTAPTVTTVPGAMIRRNTSAMLAGKPDSTADIRFLWSTNGTLGETLSGWAGIVTVTNVAPNVQATTAATNLLPATTYYWRCCASNANGMTWSPTTNSFMTHASPLAASPPPLADALVLNLDPAALPYTNNASVDWWPDVATSGTDFTTATTNNQPTYVAAVAALAYKPVVRFMAKGQRLGGGAIPAIGTGTNRTAFLVLIPSSGTGTDYFGVDYARRIGQSITENRVSIRNADLNSNPNLYSASNSLPPDSPHIVAVTDEGGQDPATRIYVNGAEATPYEYFNVNSAGRQFGWSMTTNMAVGGANWTDTTRDYIGDIAQIIIYNRVLNAREQQAVGYFLQTKFGLAGAYIGRGPGTLVMIQ